MSDHSDSRPPGVRLVATASRSYKPLVMIVAGMVAVALGIVIFLAARHQASAPAIEAVTSYVLVLVTGAYVVLTHRLLDAQRRQARDEIEVRATAELARILHNVKRFLIPSLKVQFPLEGRGPKPDFERLARPDKALLDLYWDLNRLAPDLPRGFSDTADETWRAVWRASSDTVNILWAFGREERAAAAEARPWSWEGAARFYREEHEVGRTRDPGAWYEMIRGVRVGEAIEALRRLDAEVLKLRL